MNAQHELENFISLVKSPQWDAAYIWHKEEAFNKLRAIFIAEVSIAYETGLARAVLFPRSELITNGLQYAAERYMEQNKKHEHEKEK